MTGSSVCSTTASAPALPITENGKNFYYADYRVAGGAKTYARSTYTCCSGTYLQAVTEYQNLIYFKDANSLFVNLYLPSEVIWKRPDGDAKLTQETAYPEAESITFTLNLNAKARFAIKFRVPGWAHGVSAKVNGNTINIQTAAGTWAALDRQWNDGDQVQLQIPLPLRYEPVDKWHPERVAVVRGPVVLVQDAAVHEPVYALPANDEELKSCSCRTAMEVNSSCVWPARTIRAAAGSPRPPSLRPAPNSCPTTRFPK